MLYPSGGARFTSCVAISELAPALFSTTTDCPSVWDMSCATTRPITSVGPPAVNPISIRTGFAG